jgi:membrane protein YdbS with pleckstrin-like domain
MKKNKVTNSVSRGERAWVITAFISMAISLFGLIYYTFIRQGVFISQDDDSLKVLIIGIVTIVMMVVVIVSVTKVLKYVNQR